MDTNLKTKKDKNKKRKPLSAGDFLFVGWKPTLRKILLWVKYF